MGQSPKTSIDNDEIAPARTVKELTTHWQGGACRLEPEKEQSSDVDDEARHAIRICWLRAAHGRE